MCAISKCSTTFCCRKIPHIPRSADSRWRNWELFRRAAKVFDFENYRFTVYEMDRRRIARLKIEKLPETAAAQRRPKEHPRARRRRNERAIHSAQQPGDVLAARSCGLASPLPAIWLILTMVFLLVHIVPGDPVQQMLGEDARAEDLNNLRHSLGLDQPLLTQYAHYLAGTRARRLGQLISFSEAPCFTLVLQRYPATLELALAAMLVCAAIAIPAGVAAARRRGRAARSRDWRAHVTRAFSAEFRAGPGADSYFLDWIRLACRFQGAEEFRI